MAFVRPRGYFDDLRSVLRVSVGRHGQIVCLEACCILCTCSLASVSQISWKRRYVACIQISSLALMSSRPAFRPLFWAANFFSQTLRSCRRMLHLSSIFVILMAECVVGVGVGTNVNNVVGMTELKIAGRVAVTRSREALAEVASLIGTTSAELTIASQSLMHAMDQSCSV